METPKEITKQQIPVLVARVVEFQEKFSSLSNDDGQYVIQCTAEAIELWLEAIKNRPVKKEKSEILKWISKEESLLIEALPGRARIQIREKVSHELCENDFSNYGLGGFVDKNICTPETPVVVHEVISDVNLNTVFKTINRSLDKSVMTHEQILRFCVKYSQWLSANEIATFFLTKEGHDYFVIAAHQCKSKELYFNSHSIKDPITWFAEYHIHVVTPEHKK